MFLWHFPSSRPDRTLSCTLPGEARTFLTPYDARLPGILRTRQCSKSAGSAQILHREERDDARCGVGEFDRGGMLADRDDVEMLAVELERAL